jgi:hypothetical protein
MMLHRVNLGVWSPTVLLCLCISGCIWQSKTIPVPDFDPEGITDKAFSEYDADEDGLLTVEELANCPSLKKSLLAEATGPYQALIIDTDRDKKLSKDELIKRIDSMIGSRVGRTTVAVAVLRRGVPVANADVRFVPESFMGDVIQPATGATGPTGTATLISEGGEGANYGFFRVEISRKDASGKELIPEEFNTKTILGQEISSQAPELRQGQIVIELTPPKS